jgi:hypothetical protein
MDYGYQLLRHVVQQVFGNLRAAARLTLALYLAPFVMVLLVTGGAGFAAYTSAGDAATGGGLFLGGLLTVVVAVLAYCWGAVAWHRYVLLEEIGNGFLPVFRWDRIKAYLGRAIVVIFVVLGGIIAASILIGFVTVIIGSPAVILFLGIGIVLGVSWLATRVGLVLPAAAVGERMTIGESWTATKPVSSQILLPLIVIAIVTGLIGQMIVLLFGQTVEIETFAGVQEQVTLTVVGQLLNAMVSWVQLLVNLALMTTLYGNLIEGRQLN